MEIIIADEISNTLCRYVTEKPIVWENDIELFKFLKELCPAVQSNIDYITISYENLESIMKKSAMLLKVKLTKYDIDPSENLLEQ